MYVNKLKQTKPTKQTLIYIIYITYFQQEQILKAWNLNN